VGPAVLGRQRLEDRLQPVHWLVVSARHQAEPDPEAPDPAGDADVDEVDPLVAGRRVPPDRVVEVGVAPVHDGVTAVEDAEHLLEGLLRDLAGRNHQPNGARLLELLRQLLERVGRRLDVRVVGLDLVAVLAQALRHPAAHAAQADHSELH
jgi:hypothetical protein